MRHDPVQGSHLQQPLATLQPSARARRALDALSVHTIAEFVALPRQRFLEQPGCGMATWTELERKVCRWLAERLGDDDAGLDLRRPIAPLVEDAQVAQLLDRKSVV